MLRALANLVTPRAPASHFSGAGLTSSPDKTEEPSDVGDLSVDLFQRDEAGEARILSPQVCVMI